MEPTTENPQTTTKRKVVWEIKNSEGAVEMDIAIEGTRFTYSVYCKTAEEAEQLAVTLHPVFTNLMRLGPEIDSAIKNDETITFIPTNDPTRPIEIKTGKKDESLPMFG